LTELGKKWKKLEKNLKKDEQGVRVKIINVSPPNPRNITHNLTREVWGGGGHFPPPHPQPTEQDERIKLNCWYKNI
jgi:hypothetical protein